MRAWDFITRQLVDLVVYLLVPGFSILLPTAWSRALIARISNCRWVLGKEADAAWIMAGSIVDPDYETSWKSRWKQVEMLDVRDLYLMIFGRSRSVLAEIECEKPIEEAKDRVMIGMHWGPSISILKMMDVAGLVPAFLYRPPAIRNLRIRPFFYLFLRLASHHMVKTMQHRAVLIGGAGRKLGTMLDQPGGVVVLMDAPAMQGRPTLKSRVLNREATFNAGFPTILAEKGKEYFFYALSLHPDGSVRKRLELEGPFKAESAQEFVQNYAEFLDKHLSSDSAQWRIWHASNQFFTP